jgi:hypothetical protein
LKELYDILAKYHPYAAVYKTAAEIYREMPEEERLKLRLLLVDTDTKGLERTKIGENIGPLLLDDRDLGALRQTHPGCLEAESPAGSHLVAQVK